MICVLFGFLLPASRAFFLPRFLRVLIFSRPSSTLCCAQSFLLLSAAPIFLFFPLLCSLFSATLLPLFLSRLFSLSPLFHPRLRCLHAFTLGCSPSFLSFPVEMLLCFHSVPLSLAPFPFLCATSLPTHSYPPSPTPTFLPTAAKIVFDIYYNALPSSLFSHLLLPFPLSLPP